MNSLKYFTNTFPSVGEQPATRPPFVLKCKLYANDAAPQFCDGLSADRRRALVWRCAELRELGESARTRYIWTRAP